MKIIFASDHAGYELKERLKSFLIDLGYEIDDAGAHALNLEDDYTDFIPKAAKAVSQNPEDLRAIIIGKSGQGEAIAANRFPGVRAAVYYGGAPDIISLSRKHNDSNVLSLGAGFLDAEEAKEAVRAWLETPFSTEERHRRRIAKIDNSQ